MIRPFAILVATLPIMALSFPAMAQPRESQSATPASTASDLSIEHGMQLLSNVRDNVLSFDDPAFYWFCRYVTTPAAENDLALERGNATGGTSATDNRGATGSSSASASAKKSPDPKASPTPLKFLLERPNDYRGQPVIIEGTLVAKWSWSVENRDVPSPLHQCEIAVAGTRALAAVVTTESADAIPIRSRVRVKGYFIKVRAFQTTGGEAGSGPLLVARKLTPIETEDAFGASPGEISENKAGQYWILGGTLIAAVVWLTLRRKTRIVPQQAIRGMRPSAPGHANSQGTDDFNWMLEKPDSTDTPNPR